MRQKEQLETTVKEWRERAKLALKNNKERLAREALLRKEAVQSELDAFQMTVESQARRVEEMHQALLQLEQAIQAAEKKKIQLIARAKTAKTTKQVNDMLSALTTSMGQASGNSMAAFARMQDKVVALEAAAEASANLAALSISHQKTSDSVEMEFQLLEARSAVDDELEQLKQDLSMSLSLPAARPSLESAQMMSTERQTVRIPVQAIAP